MTVGLPIVAEKPSVQNEGRARAKRATFSKNATSEKNQKGKIAPETRSHENEGTQEEAGAAISEARVSSDTPPRHSTRAQKAVNEMGIVMIRRIQEGDA